MFRPVVDVICSTITFHCLLFIFTALLFLSPGTGVEPEPVDNLTLTNSTSSSLKVSWSKYDCGILPNKFSYYRYYLDGKWTYGENKTLTTNVYTFWNLKPLQTYKLEVELADIERSAKTEISACTGQYLLLLYLVTVLFDRVQERVC